MSSKRYFVPWRSLPLCWIIRNNDLSVQWNQRICWMDVKNDSWTSLSRRILLNIGPVLQVMCWKPSLVADKAEADEPACEQMLTSARHPYNHWVTITISLLNYQSLPLNRLPSVVIVVCIDTEWPWNFLSIDTEWPWNVDSHFAFMDSCSGLCFSWVCFHHKSFPS